MIKSRVFIKFITTYILILIIPIAMISVLVYTNFVKTLKQDTIESTTGVLLQASNSMDRCIQDMENISLNIPLNSEISSIIYSDDANALGIYHLYKNIQELSNYTIGNSKVEDIYLFLKDSDLICYIFWKSAIKRLHYMPVRL